MIKRYERVGKDFVAVNEHERVVGVIRSAPFELIDTKKKIKPLPNLPPSLMFENYDGPDGAA